MHPGAGSCTVPCPTYTEDWPLQSRNPRRQAGFLYQKMVGATGIEPVTPTVSRNCNSTKSLEVSVYCLWSSFLCSDFAPRNQLQTIKREKVSPDRLDGWLRLARLIRRPANRRSMTAFQSGRELSLRSVGGGYMRCCSASLSQSARDKGALQAKENFQIN